MMKHKNIRKSVSLLLSLSLLCTLLLLCSGCGNKAKDALIGDWETTIDMTGMINDEMSAGLDSDPELMDYFSIDNFSIKLTLSFRDDDTYTMSIDEAALEDSVDQVIELFRTGIVNYFEDMIAQSGLDMTVDDVLAASGYTLDQFLEETFDKEDIMSSMDEMESSGTFEAKDNILYLTDEDGTGLEAYELDGDKLTLTGEGVDDGELEGLYPLVLTKK